MRCLICVSLGDVWGTVCQLIKLEMPTEQSGLLHMPSEPFDYPSVSVIAVERHAVVVVSVDD